MIEPKLFYRKLDSLLNTIDSKASSNDFLESILGEIENIFSSDLNFASGRIYERVEENYSLVYNSTNIELVKDILITHPGIQSILTNKLFIFDETNTQNPLSPTAKPSFAITVHNPEKRWLYVFDLNDGWIREEIELCFNAVRTAINQKMFTNSFKSELEQSAHIQQSLLMENPPKFEGFDIAVKTIPAELVGGDLYDFHQFDKNNLGFCIGDVSGHGLSSALMVRDVVTGLRMGIEKHMKMVYSIQKLNSVISRSVFSSRFVSLFYGELDKDGNILYTNAGHPPPVLLSNGQISTLDSTGLVLGALPEIELKRSFSKLGTGDILLLYTDGIIEKTSRAGEEFGTRRIVDVLKESESKASAEIVENLFNAARKFGGNGDWKDDVTIMVIKRSI